MKIEDIRLGMELVTSGGRRGWVVTIEKEGGLWLETADRMRFPVHVECVEEVGNPYYVGQMVIFDGNRKGIIAEFCAMGRVPTAIIHFGNGGLAWRSLDKIKPDLVPIAAIARFPSTIYWKACQVSCPGQQSWMD